MDAANRLSATNHPCLQILTIEELLAGKKIDMPAQQDIRSFKQAPKAKRGKAKDETLALICPQFLYHSLRNTFHH